MYHQFDIADICIVTILSHSPHCVFVRYYTRKKYFKPWYNISNNSIEYPVRVAYYVLLTSEFDCNC